MATLTGWAVAMLSAIAASRVSFTGLFDGGIECVEYRLGPGELLSDVNVAGANDNKRAKAHAAPRRRCLHPCPDRVGIRVDHPHQTEVLKQVGFHYGGQSAPDGMRRQTIFRFFLSVRKNQYLPG